MVAMRWMSTVTPVAIACAISRSPYISFDSGTVLVIACAPFARMGGRVIAVIGAGVAFRARRLLYEWITSPISRFMIEARPVSYTM